MFAYGNGGYGEGLLVEQAFAQSARRGFGS